jgi:hypothetical protein
MTPNPAARHDRRRVRRVIASTGALLLAAVLAMTGCGPDSPAGPPRPAPSPSTSSSPTPTATTAQGQAFEAAETSYRAFLASWSAASVEFDPAKLNVDVATTDLVRAATSELRKFQPDTKEGVTGRFTQDIKSIKGVSYEPAVRVVLRVCAVTNSRFIQGGKDVTRSSPNGPFAPVNTTARSNDIHFTTADGGGSWLVGSFVLDPDEGKPC